MNESLEALARKLVILINDDVPVLDDDDPRAVAFAETTKSLDTLLTEIQKVRADHPDKLAHAHLVAQAYPADFRCDEEPIMELGDGTDVWVQCWMLVKTDPDTGSLG